MINIIINADDLGYSHSVNNAIQGCLKAGSVTSATLMANAPAFDEGVSIVKNNPNASYGVHLNIIEFKPLTDDTVFRKYGLVDDNGDFREGAVFTIDDFTVELKDAIYKEWDAQIRKIKNVGIVPSHLDSHQHTHTIYGMRDIVLRLMQEHGIKRVRRRTIPSIRLMLKTRNRNTVHLDKSNAVQRKRQNIFQRRINLFCAIVTSEKWCNFFSKNAVVTNSFYAYRSVVYGSDYLIKRLDGRTVELMCHPGHPAYEEETRMVCEFRLNNFCECNYINYNDL